MKRLVFICRGNVCRSPFAEAVAKEQGLPAISYGLKTDQGTKVNEDARRIALEMGIDMGGHTSRSLTQQDLLDGDLVLGMEPGHLRDSRYVESKADLQFGLLGELSERPTPYLHDPFGSSDAYFRRCFRCIEKAVDHVSIVWGG